MRLGTACLWGIGLVTIGCGGATNSGTVPPPSYVGPQQQQVEGGQQAQVGQPPPNQAGTGQIPPIAQQMPQILSQTQRDGRGWPYGQSGGEPGIVIPAVSTDPTYGYSPQNP